MKIFIHYQERALKDRGEPQVLTDMVMDLELLDQMYDHFQIEHLLNSIGKWDDNGVVYINQDGSVAKEPWEGASEYPLEFRIKQIICEENLSDYLSKHRLMVDFSNWNGSHPIGQS